MRPSAHVTIVPATRLPAAIVGIVAFGMVGFTIVGGWQALTAQVGGTGGAAAGAAATSSVASNAAVQVRITAKGFQPSSATVKPGQLITWTNEQSIPHILTSQTLRDGSGKYLNTPAIFPGGSESFRVGPKELDRQHIVTSTTDEKLSGFVTVSVSGTAASASSSSKKLPLGSLDGVNLPTGEGTNHAAANATAGSSLSNASLSSAKSSGTTTTAIAQITSSSSTGYASIASQPTTIDTYAPIPTPTPIAVPVAVTATPVTNAPTIVSQNSYAPPTPEPFEEPHTGPGLWVVTLMSVVGLGLWGRKYLMRPESVRG